MRYKGQSSWAIDSTFECGKKFLHVENKPFVVFKDRMQWCGESCVPRGPLSCYGGQRDRHPGVNLSVPIGMHCDMIEGEYRWQWEEMSGVLEGARMFFL